MTTQITVTAEQARALMDGEEVTVVLEMDQPDRPTTGIRPIALSGGRFRWLYDEKHGIFGGISDKMMYPPAPVGSTVEVRENAKLNAYMIVGSNWRVVCTATVKDVRVVKQDGEYVALTTLKREE